MGDETCCKYVSSIGILKSCNIRSTTRQSSCQSVEGYDFSKGYDGCTLYICATAMNHFASILHNIPFKFILVSGDCDITVPDECFPNTDIFQKFINSEKIIHWYAQNCVTSHPKLSQIPIGLDYHTVAERDYWGHQQTSSVEQERFLEQISNSSLPFCERFSKCYATFHFSTYNRFGRGNERIEAKNEIPNELVYYQEHFVSREMTWRNQSKYAFVICPHGNGMDCHRQWEALVLGCIPIVKTSPIDKLYENLPVLIVNEWCNITQKLLDDTIADFKAQAFNYDKLLLKYWVNVLNGVENN